jgi:Trk K+ transport system NAD-binding subunit
LSTFRASRRCPITAHELIKPDAEQLTGHIIVCGLDGIGVTIVEQLHRSGQQVVVLEQFAKPSQLQSVSNWTRAVVGSKGSLAQTLEAAGITNAGAIVCVVAQDLQNVQLALQARHMNPYVRVVSQLGNNAVRRAMAADNGPGAVIDGATLAAPAIVEACLGRHLHEMQFGTTTFVAATVPVEGGTLRSIFGDLAPVAVTRPLEGKPPTVFACPGRDFITEAGDFATMLGTPDELAMRGIAFETNPAQRERPRLWARIRQVPSIVRAGIGEFDPGVYRALAALVTLVSISTVLLHLGYKKPGMSVLDGLYFSVETVATVGFGDFSFANQDPELRIWAIFLMLAGITTTAVLMAYVADFLISRRLNLSIGRRRARGMSGHVIVVGLGAFGLQVAARLQSVGKQVVVIERDERNRFLSDAATLDLPIIFGDATSAVTLESARLHDAAAIAILTSNDMVNIETGIAVRDLLDDEWTAGSLPVVMRVFDQSLSRTIAARFGFQNIQSIEEITAPWFVAAALGLEVLGAFSVAQQPFTIGRLTIAADSALVGVAMQGLSANTRVIALHRRATGVLEHPPRRASIFDEGDTAYIVGPNDELIGVLRAATAPPTMLSQSPSDPRPSDPSDQSPHEIRLEGTAALAD